MGDSNTLDEIKFDRGWDQRRLEEEIFKRKTIIAYLIENEISDYTRVAATIQAFINDPGTVLTLIANDALLDALDDLREMESVDIQVDPEKEALVPRPTPTDETANKASQILEEADARLLDERKGHVPTGLGGALEEMAETEGSVAPTPTPTPAGGGDDLDFGGDVQDDDLDFGADVDDIENLADAEASAGADDAPEWVDDDFVYEDSGGSDDGPIWGDDSGTADRTSATEADSSSASGGTAVDSSVREETDDEMESVFGGDTAEDDVSLFDEAESVFEEDEGSIFGDDPDDDDSDDDGGSIFGDDPDGDDSDDGDDGGSIFGEGG